LKARRREIHVRKGEELVGSAQLALGVRDAALVLQHEQLLAREVAQHSQQGIRVQAS
jgi:hypothetical protein